MFSPGTLVSSTNKTDRYDITEILLKVVLNIINHLKKPRICGTIESDYTCIVNNLKMARDYEIKTKIQ